MLFLGTDKFPSENEYGSFVQNNGGHTNAYTSDNQTVYFFDVAHNHLHGALDRFAQFFISPRMDASGTER
jgi:insulysin